MIEHEPFLGLEQEARDFLRRTERDISISSMSLERGFDQLAIFKCEVVLREHVPEPSFVIVGDCSPVWGLAAGLRSGMEALACYCVDMDRWIKRKGRKNRSSARLYSRGNLEELIYREANHERIVSRLQFFKENLLVRQLDKPEAWNRERLSGLWAEAFNSTPWPDSRRFRDLLIPEAQLAQRLGHEAKDMEELLAISKAFISRQRWVGSVQDSWLYRGIPQLAVFLHSVEDQDGSKIQLWSVCGECPPYFIQDEGLMSGADALVDYAYWLDSWLQFVAGSGSSPSFPLLTSGGVDVVDARALSRSLRILKSIIEKEAIPAFRYLDQAGIAMDEET